MFDQKPKKEVQLSCDKKGLEISCWCQMQLLGSQDVAEFRCKIDTGAHFTAIPQAVWQQFFEREDVDLDKYTVHYPTGVFWRKM